MKSCISVNHPLENHCCDRMSATWNIITVTALFVLVIPWKIIVVTAMSATCPLEYHHCECDCISVIIIPWKIIVVTACLLLVPWNIITVTAFLL